MIAGSSHPFPRPGGAVILRRVLLWSFSVLVFVSLCQSVQAAFLCFESVAPALRATASGLSTAHAVLARAGIRDIADLLHLS